MFFLRLFLLLAFFSPPFFVGAQAHALTVTKIRMGQQPSAVRLVLDLSQKANFRAFMLESPVRLVVDLPAFDWQAGAATFRAQGVRAMRYGGLEPGIARIVFELENPSVIEGAFALPRDGNKPDRLVIDFKSVSPSIFQARKGRAFGTLSSSTAPEPALHSAARVPIPDNKPPDPPLQDSSGSKPLIVIDPGHGGEDPGAVGQNGTHEKDVTLAIARDLRRQLESTGRYRVMLTRERDFFIKLKERVSIARRAKADLFVSIHADSIGHGDVSGLSFYTLSEKASDAQTEKLAAQENKADLIAGVDLSSEDKEVANILVDLAMRDTMNQSNYFAERIAGAMRGNAVRLLERPHRSAGFAVLKAPDIPSILVETGFMSNKKEEKLLNSSTHRSKIARGLTTAINAYFDQVNRNRRK